MQKKRLHRPFIPWLLAHILEFTPYYIGALLLLYGLHVSQSQIPSLAKSLGDVLLNSQDQVQWNWYIGRFFLLALGILVFRTLSRLLFFYPARVQQKNLRLEMLSLLQNVHPSRHQESSGGQVFQTMSVDFDRIRGFVGFALLQVGNMVLALIVFLPKVNEFNSELLVAFTPMAVGVVLFSVIVLFFQPYINRAQDLQGEVQNFIMETYEGKQTIKNYHSEQSFLDLFRHYTSEELSCFFKSSLGPSISIPMIRFSVGLSLIWGAQVIYSEGLEGTALIFFSGFLFLLLEPLMFLSWIGMVTSRAWGSWRRIKKLYAQGQQESSYEQDIEHLAKKSRLECLVVKLWGKQTDFCFQRSSWQVLIGETGVGKTYALTFISDLLKKKNESISFVPQEPYLFNDSIENNIMLGLERTPERLNLVKELIPLFQLDILEATSDDVLALEVGENGKKISGGQAKRVALIRSLVSGADILVWDDPFSSVDLIMEEKIFKELKKLSWIKSKTLIMSSHRLSTVRMSDRVFLLDREHQLKACGDVHELLEKDGILRSYFEKQMV